MTVFKIFLIIITLAAALYLVMICPRIFYKPDLSIFEQRLFAHRGLHDNSSDAPENSMRAFRKAVDAGYGIELDVQMTKDLVPVIFHDFSLQRVCGVPGLVKDYTYGELQQFSLCGSEEKIPRFADFLSLVNGQVPLIVEYKSDNRDMSICTKVDAMLRNYKGVYCIESFNPMVVRWYRKNHNDVVRGQLSDGFLRDPEMRGSFHRTAFLFTLQYLLYNFLTAPDFVAYNHKYRGNLSRSLCHSLYKNKAAAWTIKSEEELQAAKGHFDVMIFDSFIPREEDRKLRRRSFDGKAANKGQEPQINEVNDPQVLTGGVQ